MVKTSSSMFESLRSALLEISENRVKEKNRIKLNLVVGSLLDVACCMESEYLHDSITEIARILELECVNHKIYSPRPHFISPDQREKLSIPNFISSLNQNGGAVMIHAINAGVSSFLCNSEMSKSFITTQKADAILKASNFQPDSVLRSLLGEQDRRLCLHSLMGILVVRSALENKTSFIAHINTENSQQRLLCMVELRSSVQKNGDLYFGIKFTPEMESNKVDPFFYSLGRQVRTSSCSTTPPRPSDGRVSEASKTSESSAGGGGGGGVKTRDLNNVIKALEEDDDDDEGGEEEAVLEDDVNNYDDLVGSPETSSFDNARLYLERLTELREKARLTACEEDDYMDEHHDENEASNPLRNDETPKSDPPHSLPQNVKKKKKKTSRGFILSPRLGTGGVQSFKRMIGLRSHTK